MSIPTAGVYTGFNKQLPSNPPTSGSSEVYLVGDLGQKPTVGQRNITEFGFGVTAAGGGANQPFATTADALAFAFAQELGITVLDGVTPGTAPNGHSATIVSGTPYTVAYPTPIGGIVGFQAICDGNSTLAAGGGAIVQLWYIKNFSTGGGFNAGDAFQIGGFSLANTLGSGATYNGKYVTNLNTNYFQIGAAPFGQTGQWYNPVSPSPYTITNSAVNSNLVTLTTSSGHNINPGVTVLFEQLTHANFLNGKYFVVLSRTLTTFTVFFSTANYGTIAEPAQAGATLIGWYPDLGDQVVATVTMPPSGTMFNFVIRTLWTP